jgi:hypothetical protein
MRSTFLVLLSGLFAFSAFVAATAEEPKATGKPLRVLIVTGVDYVGHLWKETAPVIQKVLERDKRIESRIIEDPEFLTAPAVSDYDVIFLHFKNYQPFLREKEIRENLVTLVRQGKGLVAIHLACGAFEGWPEYANLVGKVLDKTSAHDPRGPFQVRIVEKNHPITRGMQDFQADDELYRCLVDGRPVQLLVVWLRPPAVAVSFTSSGSGTSGTATSSVADSKPKSCSGRETCIDCPAASARSDSLTAGPASVTLTSTARRSLPSRRSSGVGRAVMLRTSGARSASASHDKVIASR